MHTHMCLETQEMRDMNFFWDTIFIVMLAYFISFFIYFFFGGTMLCIYHFWVALSRTHLFMGHIF
jgi:hypothetical protein